MNSAALVDHLPPELQLRILEYLGPFDVLSLRRTCKTLHRVSRERMLWVSILCRLVGQNTIFEPSFPVHQMSLLQLEYAATSPDRWLRMVRSDEMQSDPNGPTLLRPCHAVVLEHEDEDEPFNDSPPVLDDLLAIHLIVGGRYLITVGDLWLAVWDLEALREADLSSATPLAVTSARFNRILLTHTTPDKQGLRILLTSYGELNYDFYIYEIYPQQQDPKLVKIAQSTVGNTGQGMSIYSISNNYLLFLRGPTLNVWDFSINKWCSMLVDWSHNQTIVTETSIAILYDDHVKVWSIPEQRHFTRDSAQTSGTATHFSPTCIIQIPSQESQRVRQCEGLCDWYSGTSQRQFFDYLYAEHLNSRRFELRIHDDHISGEIVQQDIIPGIQAEHWFEPALVCNDHIVAYWMAGNRLHIRTSITPPGGRGEKKVGKAGEHDVSESRDSVAGGDRTFILLADDSLVEEGFYLCSFCPFSGRLVYYHENGKVMIFDFLSRPPIDEKSSVTPKHAGEAELKSGSVRLRQLPLDSNDRRRLEPPEETTQTL